VEGIMVRACPSRCSLRKVRYGPVMGFKAKPASRLGRRCLRRDDDTSPPWCRGRAGQPAHGVTILHAAVALPLSGAGHAAGASKGIRKIRTLWNVGHARHSGLMLAARITFPHFSVSSARSLPKLLGEPGSAVLPRSARRV